MPSCRFENIYYHGNSKDATLITTLEQTSKLGAYVRLIAEASLE